MPCPNRRKLGGNLRVVQIPPQSKAKIDLKYSAMKRTDSSRRTVFGPIRSKITFFSGYSRRKSDWRKVRNLLRRYNVFLSRENQLVDRYGRPVSLTKFDEVIRALGSINTFGPKPKARNRKKMAWVYPPSFPVPRIICPPES